jgi:hypothetical protein
MSERNPEAYKAVCKRNAINRRKFRATAAMTDRDQSYRARLNMSQTDYELDAQGDPIRRRKTKYKTFSVFPDRGGRIADPAIHFAWKVRRMFILPTKDRGPGLCKVFNPDGTLKCILDPVTRKPIEEKGDA